MRRGPGFRSLGGLNTGPPVERPSDVQWLRSSTVRNRRADRNLLSCQPHQIPTNGLSDIVRWPVRTRLPVELRGGPQHHELTDGTDTSCRELRPPSNQQPGNGGYKLCIQASTDPHHERYTRASMH
ncbi:unnamed protein product [Boreogadus saida]